MIYCMSKELAQSDASNSKEAVPIADDFPLIKVHLSESILDETNIVLLIESWLYFKSQ